MNIRVLFIIVFTFFLGATIYNFFGELIPVRNHTGWDGSKYASLASAFKEHLLDHQINTYRFKRILPWALIYFFYKIQDFSYHLNEADIVNTMTYANFAMILISIPLLLRVLSKTQMDISVKILVFILVYCVFPIIKLPYYYPVLTDVPGFFLGMVMLYSYFHKNRILLLLTTVAGIYTFPTLMLSGVLLYIFHLDVKLSVRSSHRYDSSKYALGLSLCLLASALAYIFLMGPKLGFDPFRPLYTGVNVLSKSILPLSILGLFGYLFFITRLALTLDFRQIFKVLVSPKNLLFLVFILLASTLPVYIFASRVTAPDNNAATFLYTTLYTSMVNPLTNLVSHFDYFGLSIIVLLLTGKYILSKFSSIPLGIKLNFLLFLLFAINSESRQLMALYPFFILALVYIGKEVVAIGKIATRTKVYLIVSALLLNLYLSHFWQQINRPGIFVNTDHLAYPNQAYFKHFGPWASDSSYIIHFVTMLILSVSILLIYKKAGRNRSTT